MCSKQEKKISILKGVSGNIRPKRFEAKIFPNHFVVFKNDRFHSEDLGVFLQNDFVAWSSWLW